EEMSFYEVTNVMTFPHHAEFVTTVAASPRWLASLSPSRRQMVDDIVDALQEDIYEVQRDVNAERLEHIRERRPEMQVVDLGPDERARFRERARRVRGQYVEMVGPRGAALLRSIEAAVERAREAPAEDSDDH
ncbi:MAG: hypothetical protein KC619_07750, partial [Myxococcales bacterium]|nr:hypothetical protein [Myxococcales bacterium]